ncbi:trypsin-2 [Aplysia californica]|uniref:Trypsin-2 n=1 Tax=Aplysia californica TaxID=6500 RepID=A0ABM0JWZ4_APLCA|nr:trypsin-2 [Aplysia californica]
MAARQQLAALVLSAVCALHVTTGLVKLQPRIIGGAPVFDRCRAPFNWMVGLQAQSSRGPVTVCSGVLVSRTLVVTAARCAPYLSLPQTMAIIGERDLEMTDQDQQNIPIDSVKVHRNYNRTTLANNIALIRLSRPATITRCVQLAARYQDDPEACNDVDSTCTMVGWGPYTEQSRPTNSRLPRSATVRVYDDLVSRIISNNDRGSDVSAGNRLAEAVVDGVKACNLDWGGAVSCMRRGYQVLRGLISDHNCMTGGTPPPIQITDIPTFQIWLDTCQDNWDTCPSQ